MTTTNGSRVEVAVQEHEEGQYGGGQDDDEDGVMLSASGAQAEVMVLVPRHHINMDTDTEDTEDTEGAVRSTVLLG